MNLIDIPIKNLPSKGGRFSQLKRATYRLGNKVTIRMFMDGMAKGEYLYFSATVYKQLLKFLVQNDNIKLKEK